MDCSINHKLDIGCDIPRFVFPFIPKTRIINLLPNTYVMCKCNATSKVWQGTWFIGTWFDKPSLDLGKNYLSLERLVGETFTNPCKNIYPWIRDKEEVHTYYGQVIFM